MKLRQNPSRCIQAFQLQYKGGSFQPKGAVPVCLLPSTELSQSAQASFYSKTVRTNISMALGEA